ncbi:MAG: hypothetical protein ABSG67_21335 [Thermoguttaceae bacterium]|jgi:hypothetical protein
MNKIIKGIVHGNTIELDKNLGIIDGQKVEIVINISKSTKQWGDGIRRSAGGWADYPEMDAIMEKIQKSR